MSLKQKVDENRVPSSGSFTQAREVTHPVRQSAPRGAGGTVQRKVVDELGRGEEMMGYSGGGSRPMSATESLPPKGGLVGAGSVQADELSSHERSVARM